MDIVKVIGGTKIHIGGKLRTVKHKGDWYVVGNGMFIPELSEQDANLRIIRLQHLGYDVIEKTKEADNGR